MTELPYPPNTRHWQQGDIVLHVYDAKHPKMFMRVIGYTRDGLCKTQYVDKSRKRTVWTNELKYLLNPANFDLKGDENPEEFERVRMWNFYNPIGTPVTFKDGGGAFDSVTRTIAWLSDGNAAMVNLEGKVGGYCLRFIQKRGNS